MATNSYGWATPNRLDPQAQYSTDMGMSQGPRSQQGFDQSVGGRASWDSPGPKTGQPLQNQSYMGMPGGSGLQGYGMYGNSPVEQTLNGQAGTVQGISNQTQYNTMPYNPGSPFNYASNSYGNPILQNWLGGTPANGVNKQPGESAWTNVSWYGSPDNRAAMQGFSQDYAIPFFNAQLAQQTQDFNQSQAQWNANEQQRVNNLQYGLQQQSGQREQQALDFSQMTNKRDYTEGVRQFNVQQGLAQQQQDTDAKYKAGLITAQQYQAETGRIQANQQYELGQVQNTNTAQQIANQFSLGQGQNQNQAKQIANEFTLGNRNADIAAQNNAWNYALGQGQLGNQQFANQTGRMDVQNQFALGQGSLANQQFANQAQAARFQGQTANEAFANQAQAARFQGQTANELFANQTGRMDVQNQYALGQGSLANQQFANQAQAARFQGQTQNESFANQTERQLGQGSLANQAFANQAQAQRYQGQTANEALANQTALQNVLNQYSLGQGQLGFQNRELDVNNAYQQQQLAQQAAIAREQMQNDLQRQRYESFGRVKAPNARVVQSWY